MDETYALMLERRIALYRKYLAEGAEEYLARCYLEEIAWAEGELLRIKGKRGA